MNGTLFQGAWKIGSVFDIPVRVHVTWFIVFGLITWPLSTYYFPEAAPELPAAAHWVKGAVAALLLFASVVLHEIAHSGLIVSMEHILLGASVLVLLSVVASKASDKLGIPALLIFLGVGMLAGSNGQGGIHFDDPCLTLTFAFERNVIRRHEGRR